MNSVLKFFAVALMIFCVTFQAEAAKKTVMIAEMENFSGYNEELVARIMEEQLIVAMQSSGNYAVVERTQLDKIRDELGLQEEDSDFTDSDLTVELGKFSGAQYMVLGKITTAGTEDTKKSGLINKIKSRFVPPVNAKISLDLRLVDCKTGVIILAKTVDGEKGGKDNKTALYAACKDAAENFLREVQSNNPFVARIAAVNSDEIYIDQGLDSGIQKGENLTLFREGEPIEVDGKIVGMTQTEIGKAKVSEVLQDYSICKIVSFTSPVQKGDVAKREASVK